MENTKDYKSQIFSNISKVENEIVILKQKYNKFFSIDHIFSNENGGKTRLNRQLYNENHEDIQTSIMEINYILEESLGYLKEELKMLLAKYNQFEKLDLNEFLIDDKNFFELLAISLKTQVMSGDLKNRYINDIKSIIDLKNRLNNLKYFINNFDTSTFDRHINKLGIEELINSSLIFEVIDSYALQYEELLKFELEIINFQKPKYKINSLKPINNLLELHRRKIDDYFYADTRYKIILDFDTNFQLKRTVNLNLAYVENIISNLIEQSCMDIIKKELKKGKVQKFISILINYNKNKLQIIVKNNGFEIGDIYNLFMLNSGNKTIIETKNLVNSLNGEISIETKENEGMQYSVVIDVKNQI
ncbi:hypothetical protein [Aliarcobacter cibarius]|uniref:Two-component system sensor histidine kinase n=1 Tax=Aliarcobacter cibarius TaxID=255507 RepID=A0ABY2V5P9_9BACT|nr:hypothetical protein [Aliarcobacter cibarius]TLT00479.1 hypothetical protein FE247_04215 [Aliarcobacter cibarius]TLT00773.1 hypothetical protein FE245_04300 [Aliarcobacter cibarius]